MISFIHPLWLFGLLALLVPLLIHLWNKGQGRQIEVGSTMLLAALAPTSAKSVRLNDLLLLILRCLLLAVLALLLARPVISIRNKPLKAQNWVIVESGVANVYKTHKTQLDSLLKLGYTLHKLVPGFPLLDTAGFFHSLQQASGQKATAGIWPLLSTLDTLRIQPADVFLYAVNKLSSFSGSRPSISCHLHWISLQSNEAVISKLRASWLTVTDSIASTTVHTSPLGTFFKTSSRAGGSAAVSAPGRTAVSTAGRTAVSAAGISAIDTAVTRVLVVYDPDKERDAAYSGSALKAIKQFTRRKIEVISLRSDASQRLQVSAAKTATVLFWLSETRLSDVNTRFPALKLILKYDRSANLSEPGSTITPISDLPATPILTNEQHVTKLYITGAEGQVLWTSATGSPVLTLHRAGGVAVYHFYSRFNPAWNTLVWSETFPEVLLQLISQTSSKAEFTDLRQIAPAQMLPAQLSGGSGGDTASHAGSRHSIAGVAVGPGFPLFPYLWLLLVALFITERWVSNE